MSKFKLFVAAGEPSGDQLGAALMESLITLTGDEIEFVGVGGPLMEAQGVKSLFPMHELSVMGLGEVLPRLPNLLRRIRETAEAASGSGAAALITIDSPDFSFRVAKKVKALNPGLKTIHYVAPSVWAWRPGRAEKISHYIDHVLALLPFEPPYMTAHGMTCDFVGHPIVTKDVPSPAEIAQFRERLGVSGERKRLLCVLPGSRGSEIKRMTPIFGEVIAGLDPVKIVLPTLEHRVDLVKSLTRNWRYQPEITADQVQNRLAMAASDAALATSGTVSLDLASVATPMVISYRANWLTEQMIQRMVKLNSPNLINILTERLDVPEHLFAKATPENILPDLRQLLSNPSAKNKQLKAAGQAMEMLGRGAASPGERAARSVLSAIS